MPIEGIQKNTTKENMENGIKRLNSVLDNHLTYFQNKGEEWFRKEGWKEFFRYNENNLDQMNQAFLMAEDAQKGMYHVVSSSPCKNVNSERNKILFKRYYHT